MDILILDSWLREHLKTNASAKDIARCVSLCGPSIEKIETIKEGGKEDYIYHIEVTTNRVDMMSVRGIAREASVILPEFGFKAELLPEKLEEKTEAVKEPLKLKLINDPKLADRLMGVVLEVSEIKDSPEYIAKRLEASGIRSLNNVVDITNYVMTEVGHPTHVFDWDLVNPVMKIRESKKGEKVTSFDGKEYALPGGDIVIVNDKDELIDLPGIIGTKNSVVNPGTKRILFFIDNNDPVRIRKTSMTLGIRTVAATLNEKGVDPYLAETALKRGLYLYKTVLGAKQLSRIFDVFTNKPKSQKVTVKHSFIEQSLGVPVKPERVERILSDLGMSVKTKRGTYEIVPPSYRARDITIPEDIVEEVARIYGYHNLPSTLMEGCLPAKNPQSNFKFELMVKQIAKEAGGTETYTSALVSKEEITLEGALKIKNPLGTDSEYLRTSLMPSLINSIEENSSEKDKYFLFEVSNIYLPKKSSLPDERLTLAGVLPFYSYREAKGKVEFILDRLNIDYKFEVEELPAVLANHGLQIKVKGKVIGYLGILEGHEVFYFEIDMDSLKNVSSRYKTFRSIPKYPPQVEDITLSLPERTKAGDIISEIKSESPLIQTVELVDIYNNSYTFRVNYQSPDKTLEDSEISEVRQKFLSALSKKFGTIQK